MLDLTKVENRQELLNFFRKEGAEEHERIRRSIEECDIYEGRIRDHVKCELDNKYDSDTVKEMDIVDSINIARRICRQEASIYKDAPERKFINVKDDSNIGNWYSKTNWKGKMLKSNRLFKLQNQNVIYIPIINKKPVVKVLKKHQVHVYINEDEIIYLIPKYTMTSNRTDEKLKREKDRFTVWSKDYNFVMDGNAELIGNEEEVKDLSNPISPVVPIIDVVHDIENSYWNGEVGGLDKFTVLFNSTFSDILHIMRMQGFAIGAVTGAAKVLEKISKQTIGVNKLIKVPTYIDKDGNKIEGSMDFKNPSPDLMGCLKTLESLGYAVLTSRGADPKTISFSGDGQSFSSGWERLLSLIDKFDASKEDIDLYLRVEDQYLEIIKAYCDAYNGRSDVLESDYAVPEYESISMNVEYARPEMVETEAERTERIDLQVSKGSKSKLQGFMEMRRIDSREDAIKELEQIKEDDEEWKRIFGQVENENEDFNQTEEAVE